MKRIQSEESTPSAPQKKKARTETATLDKTSSSNKAGTVKLGVVSADLARNPLSAEKMAYVQEGIMDTVIELVNEVAKPQFHGLYHKSGWLLFVCSDLSTAEWIRINFDKIKGKCELNVMLVEEDSFPRPHIIHGFFPQSTGFPTTKILTLLDDQNTGLFARNWRVVQRTIVKNFVHLVFVVTDCSMDRLKLLKGNGAYCFGRVKLILKSADKVSDELNPAVGFSTIAAICPKDATSQDIVKGSTIVSAPSTSEVSGVSTHSASVSTVVTLQNPLTSDVSVSTAVPSTSPMAGIAPVPTPKNKTDSAVRDRLTGHSRWVGKFKKAGNNTPARKKKPAHKEY